MTVLSLMMLKFLFFRLRNRLQFSMAPTLMDDRNDAKMFKIQVNLRAACECLHCKVFLENWA